MTLLRLFCLLIALPLCGCEQVRHAQWQKAYNEKRATALENGMIPARAPRYMAPKPRFRGDTAPMVAGGAPVILPPPIIMEAAPAPAPAQPSAPQPIIFTGGGGGTTIASQVGGTTVVSQFGGVNRGTTMATQVGNSTIVTQFGGYRAPIGGYARPYCAPVGPWSGW